MSAITKHHEDFARAVIALAREHKMDGINLRFRMGINHPDMTSTGWEEITASWGSGRHGDHSDIKLEGRAIASIHEKAV